MLAAVTAVLAAVISLIADDLRAASALHGEGLTNARFEEVLVPGAAVALACCLAWFWLVTLATCLEAGTALRIGFGPRSVRAVVLAACGLTLAAGISPVAADTSVGQPPMPVPGDRHALAGLPLPDRASAQDQPAPRPAPRPATAGSAGTASTKTTITVASGDNLWTLAEQRLPANADDATVTRMWHRIWEANRAAIGSDPDLIHPGMTFQVPDSPMEK